MGTLAAITIGQTPRIDLRGELQAAIGTSIHLVERGALDALTPDEVRRGAAGPLDDLLVTRLRDGTEVKITKGFLTPRLAHEIHAVEDQADVILVLCTGTFPRTHVARPVVYPDVILRAVVTSVAPKRLGVLIPAVEQRAALVARWRQIAGDVVVHAASPYGPSAELHAAARRLAAADCDLVVMDCIGYTRAMKAAVCATTGRPVVLAISTAARVAAELAA